MRFKNFADWLKKLKSHSRNLVILVEGKRDVQALKKYGIRNIMDLSGKRFADIPDLLEGKYSGVILLFDLDEKGERINSNIGKILRSQGFEVREDFREFLRGEGIRNIEEL